MLSDKSPSAKVKIADFGLARQVGENSMAETYVGSPYYMAPEVLMKDINAEQFAGYNEKADIWSVGCIVYELITGHVPFEAQTHHQLAHL